jgi:hypothetical protein
MRRLIFAAAAVAAVSAAGSLAASRAEALPLADALAGATATQAEQVRLVCSRAWNGYAWVRRCYETRPRYYAPRRHYVPRYYRPHHRY